MEISTNNAIQQALAMLNDKLSDAAEIIRAADGAGLDYQRNPTIEIVTSPDGTVVKRVSCFEQITLEPKR
jgi:hypothetical protein